MLRTTLLLGTLTGIILGLGQWLGGSQGLVIAFVFAILMNFGSYWFSDKIVLAMYGARQVSEAEAPMLYRIVHNLALRVGMPMPRLYILPSEGANAFATGRNPQHAAVAVTEGILRLMNERELTGVLAHELSHVKNRDILISSIAATLAGVIMMVADMARWAAIFGGVNRDDDREGGGGIIGLIAMSILAPSAALVIQMAISRTHMLVALGAAFFVLVPQQAGMLIADMSRVLQGVITGMGFLGAGAILKSSERGQIRGLTTAAGIWLTAAVGIAAGMGREASAILGALLAFVILYLGRGIGPKLDVRRPRRPSSVRQARTPPALPSQEEVMGYGSCNWRGVDRRHC
jgi:heat shock protein HtpX